MEDAHGPIAHVPQPLPAVIIGPEQPVGSNVAVFGQLRQRPLQLVAGQVKRIVVDVFAGLLEGVE